MELLKVFTKGPHSPVVETACNRPSKPPLQRWEAEGSPGEMPPKINAPKEKPNINFSASQTTQLEGVVCQVAISNPLLTNALVNYNKNERLVKDIKQDIQIHAKYFIITLNTQNSLLI